MDKDGPYRLNTSFRHSTNHGAEQSPSAFKSGAQQSPGAFKSDAEQLLDTLNNDARQPLSTANNSEWQPPSTPISGAPPPRVLKRPRFSLIAAVVDYAGLLALLVVAFLWLAKACSLNAEQTNSLLIILICGYGMVRMKQLIAWGILTYQRFAPDHLRRACVFEPSCSQYALLALERYGLVAGLVKSIDRLLRCHDPNGGVDEP